MGRESGILSTIFSKSLIRYLMTEEENDEVVNRGKPGVNSVTLQRGAASLRGSACSP